MAHLLPRNTPSKLTAHYIAPLGKSHRLGRLGEGHSGVIHQDLERTLATSLARSTFSLASSVSKDSLRSVAEIDRMSNNRNESMRNPILRS
jgi:hypothetical protein